jgi:hypothetical protein
MQGSRVKVGFDQKVVSTEQIGHSQNAINRFEFQSTCTIIRLSERGRRLVEKPVLKPPRSMGALGNPPILVQGVRVGWQPCLDAQQDDYQRKFDHLSEYGE